MHTSWLSFLGVNIDAHDLVNAKIELDIDPDDKVSTEMSLLSTRLLTSCPGATFRTTYRIRIVQITRIKEKVEEQSGVPPQQQRLIFGGRQM